MDGQSRIVHALTLVQDYASCGDRANEQWKGCMWQLTKSRHHQNRGIMAMESAITAEQVREELRARTLVQNSNSNSNRNDDDDDDDDDAANNGGDLLDEEESKSKSSNNNKKPTPTWKKMDVLQERSLDTENNTKASMPKAEKGGLRQRKQPPKTSSSSNKDDDDDDNDKQEWTLVEERDVHEEELLQLDPLELFGLPPRQLIGAQKKAHQALEYYIETANQAATLLAFLQTQSEGTK